ncbi:MAG: DUF2997 domain-containing protein [Chloroflexota bacterium]
MAMQEMEIIIDKEGKVTVTTKGIKGPRCLEVSKALEEALGTIEDRGFTSEYYEQPVDINDYLREQS